MNKLLLTMYGVMFCFSCFAGDQDFAVDKIPAQLMKNADAVKRFEEYRYQVYSSTKAKLYHHYVVTVFNENADRFALFQRGYDRLVSIEGINGKLYDANGTLIKELKKKEIEDHSGVSEMTLMADDRVKTHSFYYKVYPYTVEYEYELAYNNTYLFPSWHPQPASNYAVENSSFTLICPADFAFRFKAFNYPGEPVVSEEKGQKKYNWQVKELLPLIYEYASPHWLNLTTNLVLTPEKFQVANYSGDFSSWENFGKFLYQLNYGRDRLPDAVKKKVHELTDNISDPKEKIRILYEYMQKNTRYISIQLGIGGWQPFDANYVAAKSYGDCKALSNYMYSLLKEAKIKSCYTVIQAGEDEHFFMGDFPNNQFNHVILCVPLNGDTTWLECTSQTLPAGYLNGMTANRWALAIDEDKGKLVHTPVYGINENLQNRKTKAFINYDGTLNSEVHTIYSGLQQDNMHGLINSLSKDRVKEVLNSILDFSTYDVNKFEYNEIKSNKPSIEETLDITVNNYATITGKRLFAIPNLMTRSRLKLKHDLQRKFDIELHDAYRDIDSVEIEIPAGYQVEAVPPPVELESGFGKYTSLTRFKDNKIFYYRVHEQFSGTFPAKDYNALVNFYDAIYKADHSRVVLVKKD